MTAFARAKVASALHCHWKVGAGLSQTDATNLVAPPSALVSLARAAFPLPTAKPISRGGR